MLALIIAVFMAGCTAHTLREAQQAVKEGVTAEYQFNYGKLNVQDAEILSLYKKEAKVNFQSANDILDTLLSSQKSELEKDGLLETAQVLKCICIWKLGRNLSEFDAIYSKVNENNLYLEQKALLETIHQNMILDDLDKKVKALQRVDFPSVPEFNAKAVELYESCVYNIFKGSTESQPVLTVLEEQFNKSDQTTWKIYVLESEINAYAIYSAALNKATLGLKEADKKIQEIVALWQRYTTELENLSSNPEAVASRKDYTRKALTERCPLCSDKLK